MIRAIADGDPAEFYENELAARRRFHSPPFGQLIKLTVALEDRAAALSRAARQAESLRERSAAINAAGSRFSGRCPAYIARRAGRWRFHVVLRGDRPAEVLGGDPGAPWSVDVDPESLL